MEFINRKLSKLFKNFFASLLISLFDAALFKASRLNGNDCDFPSLSGPSCGAVGPRFTCGASPVDAVGSLARSISSRSILFNDVDESGKKNGLIV